MLQGIDIGNLVITIAISVIAIAVFLGCYGLFNVGVYLWESLTGNALESKFRNCLPWLDDKES